MKHCLVNHALLNPQFHPLNACIAMRSAGRPPTKRGQALCNLLELETSGNRFVLCSVVTGRIRKVGDISGSGAVPIAS
jgi:hypothetical protein